ncbi:MAG TPA: sugar phosphate nucleotidyltransferase [bacterium]|nr:sugar phosphate nucleotidyltransferase [bacterium]HPL95529.1 sugar phosphate nucleotidyltransferase [bacterium]
MKALILAAGLGTRLQPLTITTPKALLKVGDLTLLERAIFYLRKNGVKEIAVNSHYLANQITDFLTQKKDLNICQTFFEHELLDTGGAIKNAQFFLKDSNPFIIFNADILTNINLLPALEFQKSSSALATLLVNNRITSRPFLVAPGGRLIGHFDKKNNLKRIVAKNFTGTPKEVGFLGIHLVSPKIFSLMPQENKFSSVDLYLNLVAQGKLINVFEVDDYYWQDIGTVERLQQAELDWQKGKIF